VAPPRQVAPLEPPFRPTGVSLAGRLGGIPAIPWAHPGGGSAGVDLGRAKRSSLESPGLAPGIVRLVSTLTRPPLPFLNPPGLPRGSFGWPLPGRRVAASGSLPGTRPGHPKKEGAQGRPRAGASPAQGRGIPRKRGAATGRRPAGASPAQGRGIPPEARRQRSGQREPPRHKAGASQPARPARLRPGHPASARHGFGRRLIRPGRAATVGDGARPQPTPGG
jgi:hypothetical protein